jgi:DNA-directed RNA polymerase subunit RPC12/RpoP
MTIQFHCPKCGSLIAFTDKHAGQSAKCLTCGQRQIIPEKSDQTPQKIEPKVEPEFPLPGFYRAVFVDSWKIFIDKNNLTSLVFIIAAICFKFFSAGVCCMAVIAYFAVWGYFFGFYLKIIRETAEGEDKLPEIEMGTSITFLGYIFKPIFTFVFAVFIVLLPFIIALAFFRDKGVTWENIWETKTALNLVLRGLFVAGLFLFPMAILVAAVLEDLPELLRFDRLFVPVIRAFIPYLVVVGLLAAACFIENNAEKYDWSSTPQIAGILAINLAGQVVAIIAMRSIGLFYRHYVCYFGKSW